MCPILRGYGTIRISPHSQLIDAVIDDPRLRHPKSLLASARLVKNVGLSSVKCILVGI